MTARAPRRRPAASHSYCSMIGEVTPHRSDQRVVAPLPGPLHQERAAAIVDLPGHLRATPANGSTPFTQVVANPLGGAHLHG
jgi:hypothetical protein